MPSEACRRSLARVMEVVWVPDRPDPAAGLDRRHDVLVIALTIASGTTDVLSYARLGSVFTSVITGNLVLLGLTAGTGDGAKAISTLVALVGYAVGAAGGARYVRGDGSDAVWPRRVTLALGAELVLYLGLLVGWELAGAHPTGAARTELLVVAALAMGVQGAAIRAVRVPALSTTHLTATLTGVVEGAAWRERAVNRRAVVQLVAVGVGAGVGAMLLIGTPWAEPVLPCALLAGVVVIALLGER